MSSRDTTTFAFRTPRVTDQTVLHIRFDQAGNVAAVNQTGKELVASIDPVRRQDPDARPRAAASSRNCSAISARSAAAGLPGASGAAVGRTPSACHAAGFGLSRRP